MSTSTKAENQPQSTPPEPLSPQPTPPKPSLLQPPSPKPTLPKPTLPKPILPQQIGDLKATHNVSGYRWVMLLMFVCYSTSNSMQWTQYTIIQNVVVKYYGVPSTLVSWTSMIYMVTYVPLIFPASWLLDKTGLRVTTIIGSFGTCLGAWLKVFSVPQDMFWLGFLGQTVVAISQVFILNVPPRLAAVWFGADQVSSACSIGVFGNQLGVALGFVLPPMLVRAEGSIEQIAIDFRNMFYIVAGVTSVLFVLILLFFKKAPPTSPSAAAEHGATVDSDYFKTIKSLFTNRNYVLLLLSYGLNVGVFYAISTLLNQVILDYFPGAGLDAGRIGLMLVVAGMAGSVCCGLVLDKTHRFKETTLVVYFMSAVGMLIYTLTLDCGIIAVVYITSMILGFFMTGYLPVGFEFASEVTYPEPEGTTSGILNAVVQVFGIILTLTYEALLTEIGTRWSNFCLCGILVLGTGITFLISSDLRRQAASKRLKAKANENVQISFLNMSGDMLLKSMQQPKSSLPPTSPGERPTSPTIRSGSPNKRPSGSYKRNIGIVMRSEDQEKSSVLEHLDNPDKPKSLIGKGACITIDDG